MFFNVALCVGEFLFHNPVITRGVVSFFYSLYFPIITSLQEQKSEDMCFLAFYLYSKCHDDCIHDLSKSP